MIDGQFRILHAIGSYCRQLGIKDADSEKFISSHIEIANKLVTIFEARFNPSSPTILPSIAKEIEETCAEFKKLALIFENLISKAIVRTNFFMNLSYISFKIDLALFDESLFTLPRPLTFKEIFIFSDDFEAIHIRNGRIARGGLRWSDRKDDFRTEVLGLVKTQNAKNTVVVPVGSKGGFVVKKENTSDALEFGKECYIKFITALLEITDNVIHGEVITPEGIVAYDEKDPYLAVAADKGTAKFSDIANSVSKKFNFWLGDAFASGGSQGYDHKKIGITSRGGWIAVERHFREMGIDVSKEEFSVVAVGDMSGDVFGNGLLRSRKIKLIFAFNHMNIFVDPSPNAEASFLERERLFTLPTSTWESYDLTKASKGAKVFKRSDKTCDLTPEIQSLFGITQSSISPEDLIKTALKSKFDLFWNGGIGTYFKASFESDGDAGDKTNDNLRINGSELGAKVVGEGGNLGFTQYGRVEFELSGGRINTDAIDNSAGVDCSDHEVNIKILLNPLVFKGEITTEERNKMIAEMTGEVSDLVLEDNYNQTLALSLEKNRGGLSKIYPEFLKNLTLSTGLDQRNEKLPSNEDVLKRGLTRPEIAILLAYSKMESYQALILSNVVDDKFCERFLINYFPKKLTEKFLPQILSHQLRREIISTVMSNRLANFGGLSTAFEVMTASSRSFLDVIKAYFIADIILELQKVFDDIKSADYKISSEKQYEILLSVREKVLIPTMLKILEKSGEISDMTKALDQISAEIKSVSINTQDFNLKTSF